MYVFYSTLYMDKEQNKYPKLDLILTTLLAILWLAGASAWAHGLSGLHLVTSHHNRLWTGHFTVLLAFINCFLWVANIWFIYKETSWFSGVKKELPASDVEEGVVGEEIR